MDATANEGKNILLFDGVCNLCNGLVQFIIKRDYGAVFKFASLQSDGGRLILSRSGLEKTRVDSVILIKGEQVFLRSTAALHVLRDLGGIWRLFYVFILIPRPIRDFVYDLVAKSRYRIFGRRQDCMIPTPDLKDRFL